METPVGKAPARQSTPPAKAPENLAVTISEGATSEPVKGQEATQVFNETVQTPHANVKTTPPAAKSAAAPAKPAAKTQPSSVGAATELFNEQPGAPGARPPKKTPPAALGATELFDEKSAGLPKASVSNPSAVKPPATQPMGATGEFVESSLETKDQTQAFGGGSSKDSSRKVPASRPGAGNPEAGDPFGDFQLDQKLGEGGMGAVYKATQISMDRTVALKLLAKNLAGNQGFVDRFYREARTMAKLDHPNIVRGFAVGQDKDTGQHFVAMEFIDGLSMQKWMDKLGKLSVGDAVHVVLCSAYALQHAHEQSLIHRDIKPDNILMTSKGVVKVADLGLAKKTDDDMSLTQSGTGFGTPYYMPLEQYRDAKHVDGRADIYALGVTLYYFVTGKLPFFGDTHFDVIKLKEAAKFTPARKHNSEIPERLDLMIDKMIQKDKKYRYQTCAEVIEALESLGVHSEFPSFIGAPPPAAKSGATTASRPSTLPPKKSSPPPTDDEPAREMWVLRQKDPSGKVAKRQVSTGRLKQLLERGEIDPTQATVQRSTEQNQRPISSVPEFASLVQSKSVETRADRRSQKLENAYDKLEREADRRARFKKLSNMFRSVATFVILIAVLAALAFGGWCLFKNKDTVVQKVQEATKDTQAPADMTEQPK